MPLYPCKVCGLSQLEHVYGLGHVYEVVTEAAVVSANRKATEKEIDEIRDILSEYDDYYPHTMAEYLHDAGYRKLDPEILEQIDAKPIFDLDVFVNQLVEKQETYLRSVLGNHAQAEAMAKNLVLEEHLGFMETEVDPDTNTVKFTIKNDLRIRFKTPEEMAKEQEEMAKEQEER